MKGGRTLEFNPRRLKGLEQLVPEPVVVVFLEFFEEIRIGMPTLREPRRPHRNLVPPLLFRR